MRRDDDYGKRIFIAGLNRAEDPNALKQILTETFERFGLILDIYIPMDYDTHASRGIAFITFADEMSARQAVSEMTKTEVDGRKVHVDLARPKTHPALR